MPKLRVVSRVGIGFDNIVVPDATQAGVAVCNTPDGPTAPTAEIAVMLMIAASRFATRADRLMRARRPDQGTEIFAPLEGMQLRGRTLGLVGFGRIGRAVAAAAKGLGMEVVAYDPVAKPEDGAKLGVKLVATVDEVLRAGDVVSLHVPASPETRKMINARALGLMKKGAVLVNAARGALVDEAALAAALDAGRPAAAGIDVFAEEPPPADHPLRRHEAATLTAHAAFRTPAATRRLVAGAFAIVNRLVAET
jgi:phosphoglycerate dehydrogenase-like enzyme